MGFTWIYCTLQISYAHRVCADVQHRYFQHPPRYQLLHCLRNRVEGGTSVFVDALHAANRFRESHPADFDVLTKTLVPFHYINNDNHLHHEHPTIELDASAPDELDHKPVQFINFSPPFQAPLPVSTPPAFYAALARFSALLHEPDAAFTYTLREGDAVLFDNRRVLHARTAFNDAAHEDGAVGETNRWLKGCYLEADAVLNRRRVLQRKVAAEGGDGDGWGKRAVADALFLAMLD